MFDMGKWCDQFKSLETIPMDEQLSRVMLAVMLEQVNREAIEDIFVYKMIQSRADAIGLELEQKLQDFLSVLCTTPGEAVMYLSLLRQEQSEGKKANMENFVDIFPTGFPNNHALGELWDAQKQAGAPLGNALDYDWWSEGV